MRAFEFFVRMLFSCLVDADFLDTEAFYAPGKRSSSEGFDRIPDLRRRLDTYIGNLAGGAPDTAVNRVRSAIRHCCVQASEQPPGIFSLSAPTGGGKTLASLSFALRHAETHGLRRVIVAIPYTSIIEQNAKAFRDALGAQNVVEHHASIDPEKETERNRLASENWDAPVVVTTSVQFFESLFANKPSRCRKLHNVAKSVIVLDEVQVLPPQLLAPILEGLRELAAHYGSTVVLSTATQPALAQRDAFPQGLPGVREIVESPAALADRLRRVRVELPPSGEPTSEWSSIAEEAARHERVLVVVNRRKDARELAEMLPEGGRFHLSALMCPKHRAEVLETVKAALRAEEPCRLVATQVVEAGVDIDFPVVYRAMAGLDSIVQAAGRCNREGLLPCGAVRVFRSPSPPPAGELRKAAEVAESVLASRGGTLDLALPSVHEEFFRKLYFASDLDAKGIQALRQSLQFDQTAKRFQMIEDGGSVPVVVPYGDSARIVKTFRNDGPSREVFRALQPFIVSVYPNQLRELERAGAVEPLHETLRVLSDLHLDLYDSKYGLLPPCERPPDPGSMVV